MARGMSSYRDAPLFCHGELRNFLVARQGAARNRIKEWPADEIRLSPAGAVEAILDQFGLHEVHLDWSAISHTEVSETEIEGYNIFGDAFKAPGQSISLVVPLQGSYEILNYKSQTRTSGVPPAAFVSSDRPAFRIEDREVTKEKIEPGIATMQQRLTTMIGWANDDVRGWMNQLRPDLKAAAEARAERLTKALDVTALLSIPLASAPSSQQFPVPVQPRRIAPRQTAAPATTSFPNYVLEDSIYEDVLATITSLARGMERLPRTSVRFTEPELRDLVLFVLNSNYRGAARGEVINGDGKTDLLLPWNDSNVFIGEFKVWKGAKGFAAAVDQMLGYTVWRDTKAALLLFIKQGQPTAILDKADGVIRAHRAFRNASPAEPDIRRDYLLSSLKDPGRLIKTTLLPVVVMRTGADDGRSG